MFDLHIRMTSITWLVTSLLLSVLVSITVGCNKLANGNWMKKMGDVRTDDGWFKRPERTQNSRLLPAAEMTGNKRTRNRRNQEGSLDDDYESFSSSVDPNAIDSEVPDLPTPRDIFQQTDINGDGIVTKMEYREVNRGVNDQEVRDIFSAKDRNRDGGVTWAEFMGEEPNSPLSSMARCEQHLMEVCDFRFINATRVARQNPSISSTCNNFQIYVDCLAVENQRCGAEVFTQKIYSIASGLRDDGECPDLQLAALRYPDAVRQRQELPFGTDTYYNHHPRPQSVDIFPEPLIPVYGSGSKQGEEDFKYGYLFDAVDEMMLADGITDTTVSSNTDGEDAKVLNSKHDRRLSNGDSERMDRTEVSTLANEGFQLHNDERELFKSDNVQSVTSSWRYSTEKTTSPRLNHHRRQHTSQSTEQLEQLKIRQVRSSTTKRRPIEKSRRRSRPNCAMSTIAPCNEAFIGALAFGEEDPCESLVRYRHCVHKNTRQCTDFNVFKIREGLKYLSKEHRRAKLCGQVTL